MSWPHPIGLNVEQFPGDTEAEIANKLAFPDIWLLRLVVLVGSSYTLPNTGGSGSKRTSYRRECHARAALTSPAKWEVGVS